MADQGPGFWPTREELQPVTAWLRRHPVLSGSILIAAGAAVAWWWLGDEEEPLGGDGKGPSSLPLPPTRVAADKSSVGTPSDAALPTRRSVVWSDDKGAPLEVTIGGREVLQLQPPPGAGHGALPPAAPSEGRGAGEWTAAVEAPPPLPSSPLLPRQASPLSSQPSSSLESLSSQSLPNVPAIVSASPPRMPKPPASPLLTGASVETPPLIHITSGVVSPEGCARDDEWGHFTTPAPIPSSNPLPVPGTLPPGAKDGKRSNGHKRAARKHK